MLDGRCGQHGTMPDSSLLSMLGSHVGFQEYKIYSPCSVLVCFQTLFVCGTI